VVKAVEPPPQQNTQIPSYAVVGAGYAGLRAWFTRRGLGMHVEDRTWLKIVKAPSRGDSEGRT
jgi:hypothetical protein